MANAGEFPKVDGDLIYRDDYNIIRQAVYDVLTTWWNDSTATPALTGNPVITRAQLDSLISDINRAYTHITGAGSGLAVPAVGAIIENELWSSLAEAAQYIETNKTTMAIGQYSDTIQTQSTTPPWNGSQGGSYYVYWSTTAQASEFFKRGGTVRFFLTHSTSSGSQKDVDWQGIINELGTITYNYNNWIAGTQYILTAYGNQTQYAENYGRLVVTKLVNGRGLGLDWILEENDAGDQTGLGAAVDENVNLTVTANFVSRAPNNTLVGPFPTWSLTPP